MTETPEKFEHWVLLEIMGRQRYAGLASEMTIAGAGMLRLDIPATEKHGAFTKFFGPGSIHSMTPIEEKAARHLAETLHQAPIEQWELPKEYQKALTYNERYSDDDFDDTEDY